MIYVQWLLQYLGKKHKGDNMKFMSRFRRRNKDWTNQFLLEKEKGRYSTYYEEVHEKKVKGILKICFSRRVEKKYVVCIGRRGRKIGEKEEEGTLITCSLEESGDKEEKYYSRRVAKNMLEEIKNCKKRKGGIEYLLTVVQREILLSKGWEKIC